MLKSAAQSSPVNQSNNTIRKMPATQMPTTRQGGSVPKRLLIAPDRLNEDLTFQALRQLQANPKLRQRQLAKALGISLGKTNYCLRALIARGLVKAEHFRTSNNKLAYAYLLTPEGIETKTRITARFLNRKPACGPLLAAARAVAEQGHPIPRLPKHPGGGDEAKATYPGKPHGSPRAHSKARGVRTFRSVSLQRKHNNTATCPTPLRHVPIRSRQSSPVNPRNNKNQQMPPTGQGGSVPKHPLLSPFT